MDRVSGALGDLRQSATQASAIGAQATAIGAKALDTAQSAATTYGAKAIDTAQSTATTYGSKAIDTAQKAAEDAAALAKAAASSGQKQIQEYQNLIELFVKRKLVRYLGLVVDKIPGIVKDATYDPDMPQLVARGKDRAIDAIWPDIKEEIMWSIAETLDGKEQKDEELPPGVGGCRAFFRYHLFPYDKSSWGKMRDPVWVIFTLVSLIPWAGMCPLIFLFIFIIIDKSDEFQLTQFILQFKGTQFISHGLIKAMIGYFTYLNCVTVPATPGEHYCDETGPNAGSAYQVIVAGWFLQVMLIWCAFVNIFRAEDKGRLKLQVVEHESHGTGAKAGGYLRYLLTYDMVCFLACAAALGYVLSTRAMRLEDWPVRHAFFAAQIVYGYTSTPFFIFTLPGLQVILTHTVPTAYDQEGRARKLKGAPPPPKKPMTLPKIISANDAEQLRQRALQIFTEGKSASALFADWKDDDEEKALRSGGAPDAKRDIRVSVE